MVHFARLCTEKRTAFLLLYEGYHRKDVQSTLSLHGRIHLMYNSRIQMDIKENYFFKTLTLSRSWNRCGSQLAIHHLSTCPAICSLSTTICIDASFFEVRLTSLLISFWAYFQRWQPSS